MLLLQISISFQGWVEEPLADGYWQCFESVLISIWIRIQLLKSIRIRIQLLVNTDPDPAFEVSTDPDPGLTVQQKQIKPLLLSFMFKLKHPAPLVINSKVGTSAKIPLFHKQTTKTAEYRINVARGLAVSGLPLFR